MVRNLTWEEVLKKISRLDVDPVQLMHDASPDLVERVLLKETTLTKAVWELGNCPSKEFDQKLNALVDTLSAPGILYLDHDARASITPRGVRKYYHSSQEPKTSLRTKLYNAGCYSGLGASGVATMAGIIVPGMQFVLPYAVLGIGFSFLFALPEDDGPVFTMEHAYNKCADAMDYIRGSARIADRLIVDYVGGIKDHGNLLIERNLISKNLEKVPDRIHS